MATNKIVSSDYNIQTPPASNVTISTGITKVVGNVLQLNTGNNSSNTYLEFVNPAASRATPNVASIRWNGNGVGSNLGRFEWTPFVSTNPMIPTNWYGFLGTDSTGNIVIPSASQGTQSVDTPGAPGFSDANFFGNVNFFGGQNTLIIEGNLEVTGNATFVNKQAVTVSNNRIYVANSVISSNISQANGAGFVIGPPNGTGGNNDGFVNFVWNQNLLTGPAMTLDTGLQVANYFTSAGNVNAGNSLNVASNAYVANGVYAGSYYFGDGSNLIQANESQILYAHNSNATGNNNFVWDNANSNVNVLGNVNLSNNLVIYSTGIVVTSNNIISNNQLTYANIISGANVTGNSLIANVSVIAPLINTINGNVVSANNLSNYYYYNDTKLNLTAGSNNYVQYNEGNRFSATSALQFNPTSNLLAVAGPVQASSFVFANGTTLSSGTPPGGTNYNFQYNQNGSFSGAATFNYDIGSGNVTNQGNVVTTAKTLSIIAIDSSVVTTPSTTSTFATATNGAVSVALEKPQSSIVTTGASVTSSGSYSFVKYTFANLTVIVPGSQVSITGYGAGLWTVIDSGLGYANVQQLTASSNATGAFTSANITLPVNLYYSTTGTAWTPISGVTTPIPDATPAEIKYDSVANIFYAVVTNPGGTTASILRSTDGSSWTVSSSGITTITLSDFAYDQSSNSYVVAGANAANKMMLAVNGGNGVWQVPALPATVSGTMRSVAADDSGRFVATDGNGSVYTANAANLLNWTQSQTATYTASQAGYPYAPLVYQSNSNTFIWANNYVAGTSTYLVQQITFSPFSVSTLYTSNAYIQSLAVSPSQLLLTGNASPNTSVVAKSGNSFVWLANVPGVYTQTSINPTTNQILFADSNAQIGYAQLVTAGGGNVYANNVIANTSTSITGNVTNINVSGVANISSIGNLQVNGGNVGQFVGVNTSNVLTFIDRVAFANLNLGSSLPTTAAINAQLPANLANKQQNGSMVFNTETSTYNTQPLYIYLNGAWRQMMVSKAL